MLGFRRRQKAKTVGECTLSDFYQNAATMGSCQEDSLPDLLTELLATIRIKCGHEPNFQILGTQYTVIGYVETTDDLFDPLRFARITIHPTH